MTEKERQPIIDAIKELREMGWTYQKIAASIGTSHQGVNAFLKRSHRTHTYTPIKPRPVPEAKPTPEPVFEPTGVTVREFQQLILNRPDIPVKTAPEIAMVADPSRCCPACGKPCCDAYYARNHCRSHRCPVCRELCPTIYFARIHCEHGKIKINRVLKVLQKARSETAQIGNGNRAKARKIS